MRLLSFSFLRLKGYFRSENRSAMARLYTAKHGYCVLRIRSFPNTDKPALCRDDVNFSQRVRAPASLARGCLRRKLLQCPASRRVLSLGKLCWYEIMTLPKTSVLLFSMRRTISKANSQEGICLSWLAFPMDSIMLVFGETRMDALLVSRSFSFFETK